VLNPLRDRRFEADATMTRTIHEIGAEADAQGAAAVASASPRS